MRAAKYWATEKGIFKVEDPEKGGFYTTKMSLLLSFFTRDLLCSLAHNSILGTELLYIFMKISCYTIGGAHFTHVHSCILFEHRLDYTLFKMIVSAG